MEDLSLFLPEKPRDGLVEWTKRKHPEQLGDEFCVFRRESIAIYPELKRKMTQEDYEEFDKNTKRRWGAACTCTACGEDFYAGYWSDKASGQRGISLMQFEDGTICDGFIENDDDCAAGIGIGDQFPCPYCCEYITLIPASELRAGRTYQIAIASVERIPGNTAAIVVWMVTRHVTVDTSWTECRPFTAITIGPKGKLTGYTHVYRAEGGMVSHKEHWRKLTRRSDGMRAKYYDYDSMGHLKSGGYTWPDVPNIDGSTGEKTGLADYVKRGGQWPNLYIETWRNHKNIEQLIKSPLGAAIADIVDDALNYHWFAGYSNCYPVDFTETKPHKMLYMSKEDFRHASTLGWTKDHVIEWVRYKLETGGTVEEFESIYRALTLKGLKNLIEELKDVPGWTPQRIVNYLSKQSMCDENGVQHYIDYRKAMIALHRDAPETWFPKNLVQAHNAASAQLAVKDNLPYTAIVAKYAPVAYSDGKICIRVAASQEELTAEGNTLHHCVGGYSKAHQSGKDVIFFVRHARRPERSWYTLDIRMTEARPYKVQLHGYKNEISGAKNRKPLTIPKEVNDFVNKWISDILLPWWEAQQHTEITTVNKSEVAA